MNERITQDEQFKKKGNSESDGQINSGASNFKENKQDKEEKKRMMVANGLAEYDEDLDGDDSEIIRLIGARDEQFYRRLLYFSNFEDMLFQMNGLNASNIFGAGSEVSSQLSTYHKESLKFNILRNIGSINLIGNPSKYIKGVGTGVTDFFVKPYQGMKDGSIVKAAGGFADGSKSLLKNAVMAPVGAMSKLGSSISKGTLALSFDDKFIEEKNANSKHNKP